VIKDIDSGYEVATGSSGIAIHDAPIWRGKIDNRELVLRVAYLQVRDGLRGDVYADPTAHALLAPNRSVGAYSTRALQADRLGGERDAIEKATESFSAAAIRDAVKAFAERGVPHGREAAVAPLLPM
jgi:hypothetical protein